MAEDKLGEGMSRRDFLKQTTQLLAGSAILGLGGNKLLSSFNETPDHKDIELTKTVEPLEFTSKEISGVEVYGLNEKLNSIEDVKNLYTYLNNEFAKNNNIEIPNTFDETIELRRKMLNPNERYAEFVVRRSAYDSFIQKQTETGVNFPEWAQIHIDVLNRCMEMANPPSEMKTILRRVVVVEDSAVKEIWDEDAYNKGKGEALDTKWLNIFGPFPIDTDASWAIASDYRDSNSNSFYKINHKNDKTVMISEKNGTVYEFPEKNDSLFNKNNIRFDMGINHELSHRLLNLPDEYTQDVHDNTQRFKDFTIGTGCFESPYFSPHLSYLLKENIKLNARTFFSKYDRATIRPDIHPEKIEVSCQLEHFDNNATSIGIRGVRVLDETYYGAKKVPQNADMSSETNTISFDNRLFQEKSNCWLISATNGNCTREVFLPVAAFNMSKIAGLESAKYNLTFTDYDDSLKTKQEVVMVNDTDIDKVGYDGKKVYAKMKVDGTNTWFVWHLW